MELPTTLKDLAEILRLRKQSLNPYNLLLTSTVSLTPEVLIAMYGKNDWDEFCTWLRRRGIQDRIDTLKPYLSKPVDPEGYLSLARLLKEGYFSTVLTTNLDSFLEDALFESSLPSTAYQVLVVNRDRDEHIATALENEPKGIRIIKIRGNLSDRAIPPTFPELFDFGNTLRGGLERYINRDVVIVGSIEREDDLRRSLAYHGGRIYYAIPHQPTPNDDVVKAIRARGIDLNAALISGPYGHFAAFFKALELLLLPDSPTQGNITPPTRSQSIDIQNKEEPSEPPKVTIPSHEAETPSPDLVKDHTPSHSSTTSEKEHVHSSNTLTESFETSSPAKKANQGGATNSLIRIIATALIVLAGIGFIFLMVALFSRNTPSFTPSDIIFLLVIAAGILLGIVGILNSEQITKILTMGVSAANDNSTKSEDKRTGKTKDGKDKENKQTERK